MHAVAYQVGGGTEEGSSTQAIIVACNPAAATVLYFYGIPRLMIRSLLASQTAVHTRMRVQVGAAGYKALFSRFY